MSHSLLISDLHLNNQEVELTRLFEHFLTHIAPDAEALYILGDLFEYWLGDDTLDLPLHQQVCHALRQLSDAGVKLFFMHGNRDFLLGTHFAEACGARFLPDPSLIDLHGTPSLLMHGDTLCTDDVDYQAFRQQVHQPAWQQQFLAQTLSARVALAQSAREQSTAAKQNKSASIMDVNPDAVINTFRQYGYPRLIHGHTHRPAHHCLTVDEHACERWVLHDWHGTQGGYLRCDEQGCQLIALHTP
jgi:UDP-2,3-diacylglucosamine hydrolase